MVPHSPLSCFHAKLKVYLSFQTTGRFRTRVILETTATIEYNLPIFCQRIFFYPPVILKVLKNYKHNTCSLVGFMLKKNCISWEYCY